MSEFVSYAKLVLESVKFYLGLNGMSLTGNQKTRYEIFKKLVRPSQAGIQYAKDDIRICKIRYFP